ncbi:MAG: alpha/beta fold hydrolase [Actinomycetota bacterium]|nr:alpha/beta fold hydrolase [Actinomycetota bacterium]
MNYDTETRNVGGHDVRVLRSGGGEPVLVLHGWGGRIESMAPVVNCLRPHMEVIALDLPGFGESPAPRGVWGTADYAQFVADVLSDLGIERAHFVGHSFGAKTSLYLAATQAAAVDKLVIVGSSGLTSPPSAKVRAKRAVSKVARAAGKLGGPGQKLRDAVYDRIASQDYKDAGPMRPIMVKVVNEDIGYLLHRVRSSTLLVWGSEDDAVPLAHARAMESLIPDSGLVVFEGAGHFAYLDEPDRFCRVVKHFFEAS